MTTYNEGRYIITMDNGTSASVYLTKTEAKTLMTKFAWLKILNIKSVEHNDIQ